MVEASYYVLQCRVSNRDTLLYVQKKIRCIFGLLGIVHVVILDTERKIIVLL